MSDICNLTKLERLDLRCALRFDTSRFFNEDEDDESDGPYFDVIADIVSAAKESLKSLNLGTIDSESRSMMFRYSIKPSELWKIKQYYGIKISVNTFDGGHHIGADSDDDDEDRQFLGFDDYDDEFDY